MCTLLRRFNFSGIFLHHIVAWPSGNSSTKNYEDRPRGSPPPRGLNSKGVVKQANIIKSCLTISSPDEFLDFVSPKAKDFQLKIHHKAFGGRAP